MVSARATTKNSEKIIKEIKCYIRKCLIHAKKMQLRYRRKRKKDLRDREN